MLLLTVSLGWRPVLLLLPLALAAWTVWRALVPDRTDLHCVRSRAACAVTREGDGPRRLPLATIRRFEVWQGPKASPKLLAIAPEGNYPLVGRWEGDELRQHAAELNRFLLDPTYAEWRFTYDHRWTGLGLALGWSAALVAIAVAIGLHLRPWKARFDRAKGEAVCRRALRTHRRPLSAFRAVQLRTPLDERLAQLRRLRRPLGYSEAAAQGAACRLVLVAKDGSTWPVTRYLVPQMVRSDIPGAAERMAAFLGLPVTHPPPPPPPGTVPPPLDPVAPLPPPPPAPRW